MLTNSTLAKTFVAAAAIAISSLAITSVYAKPHSSSIMRSQDNAHTITGRVDFYNPDRVGFELIGERTYTYGGAAPQGKVAPVLHNSGRNVTNGRSG
jgi:hypothetical protein